MKHLLRKHWIVYNSKNGWNYVIIDIGLPFVGWILYVSPQCTKKEWLNSFSFFHISLRTTFEKHLPIPIDIKVLVASIEFSPHNLQEPTRPKKAYKVISGGGAALLMFTEVGTT